MKYLLDTHVWLWAFTGQSKLGPKTNRILSSGNSELYLSAVTSWEITIKWSLQRLVLLDRPGQLIAQSLRENGLLSLPVKHEHAWRLGDLARHHHDPFDRLLVAQAIHEGMVLITADPQLRNYPVELAWALE